MRKRIKNLLWIAKDFHVRLHWLCTLDWASQVSKDVLWSSSVQAWKSRGHFISYSFVLQRQEFSLPGLQLQQNQQHRHSHAYFVRPLPKTRWAILGHHHSILIHCLNWHPHRHKCPIIYEKPSQNHKELPSRPNDSTKLQYNHSRFLFHNGCLLLEHTSSVEHEPAGEQSKPRGLFKSSWEVLA